MDRYHYNTISPNYPKSALTEQKFLKKEEEYRGISD